MDSKITVVTILQCGGGSEQKNYMREAPSWNKISDRPDSPEMDRRQDMSPGHKPSGRRFDLEKFMNELTDRMEAMEARMNNRMEAMEARMNNRMEAM